MRTRSPIIHSDAIILILMAGIVGWLWWHQPLVMLLLSAPAVMFFIACCIVGALSDGRR